MNRIPERKDGLNTYNRIIKTSKVLFAKKGFHGTPINEIITKSKIATGTFYQYFSSKKDVYFYLVNDYRTRIFKTIREATSKYETRYDIEYHGIKAYLEFIRKDKLAYQIIWESLFVDKNYFYNYYVSFAKSYQKQLLESNQIKDNIDLETLSFCLIGISNFVGIQILSKDNLLEIDIDTYVKEIMKILNEGIFK